MKKSPTQQNHKRFNSQYEERFKGLRLLISECGRSLLIKKFYPQFQQPKMTPFYQTGRNGYFINVEIDGKCVKLDVDSISGKIQYKKLRTSFISKPSFSKIAIYLFNATKQQNFQKLLQYIKQWQENVEVQFSNNIILVLNNYNQSNIMKKIYMSKIINDEVSYQFIPLLVFSQLNQKSFDDIMNIVYCIHFCHNGNSKQVKNYISKRNIQLQNIKKQLKQKKLTFNQTIIENYSKFIKLICTMNNFLNKSKNDIHSILSKIQYSLHYTIYHSYHQIQNLIQELNNIQMIQNIIKKNNINNNKIPQQNNKVSQQNNNKSINLSNGQNHKQPSPQLNHINEIPIKNKPKVSLFQKLQNLYQQNKSTQQTTTQKIQNQLTIIKKQYNQLKQIKNKQQQLINYKIIQKQNKFYESLYSTEINLYLYVKSKSAFFHPSQSQSQQQQQTNISNYTPQSTKQNYKTKIIQQLIQSYSSLKQLFITFDQILNQLGNLIQQIIQTISYENPANNSNEQQFLLQILQLYLSTKISQPQQNTLQQNKTNHNNQQNCNQSPQQQSINSNIQSFKKSSNLLFQSISQIISYKLIQQQSTLQFFYQLQQIKISQKALRTLKNRLEQANSQYLQSKTFDPPKKFCPIQ